MKYHLYMERWLFGEESGTSSTGEISEHIKRYLRELYNDKCQICGWGEINPKTGKAPLTVHHIDGDWRNNQRENLEFLCPNHHSLTSTYGSMNRGNGRPRYTVVGQR